MQIDLDRIRRWLPAIAHTSLHLHRRALLAGTGLNRRALLPATGLRGRALLAATGLTTLAAVAAGTTSVSALSEPAADPSPSVALAPATTDAPAPGDGLDRDTKVRIAREKAEADKAAKAAQTAPGRAQAAKGPSADDKAPARADRKAPPVDKLLPNGVPGGQSAFTPSVEQMRNAKAIVDTGRKMNLPERAYVIAVATSLQESKLQNLGHLGAYNDHDSLGLFQQRPSTGWGTPKQVTDPRYASEQFYKGLQRVPGYEKMPLTRAAQTVQVSAFPDAYAQWEKMAADLVLATYGDGPYADVAAAVAK